MQMSKKASKNVFLFQITLKINFWLIVQNNHYSNASSRTPCFVPPPPPPPRLRTPALDHKTPVFKKSNVQCEIQAHI